MINLEERFDKNCKMKAKETKEEKNLQVSGEQLPDKELYKLVKEAEKGPFMSLEEHNTKMNKWIQDNSR